MNELNKLIEGINDLIIEEERLGDLSDDHLQTSCHYTAARSYEKVRDMILAHALNNLDATHHPTEVSAGHQPKEGEWIKEYYPNGDYKGEKIWKPVSGERTGEEGVRSKALKWWRGLDPDERIELAKEHIPYRQYPFNTDHLTSREIQNVWVKSQAWPEEGE